MTSLLVALGILVCFGVLFWLDRYYKDSGNNKNPEEIDSHEEDSADDAGHDSETV